MAKNNILVIEDGAGLFEVYKFILKSENLKKKWMGIWEKIFSGTGNGGSAAFCLWVYLG